MSNTTITLTASMRSNLMSLKSIATQMDKTQTRLSTGKKVNSAIDNASAYYQARALTNRASDLSALLDSMGQGIQTIQAATEGLTSATSFLEQATAVANQALASDFVAEDDKAPTIISMARSVDADINDYIQVGSVAELNTALADPANKKILITESLTFAENEHVVVSSGVTLRGAKGVELNFTNNNAYGLGASNEEFRNASAIVLKDGARLESLVINAEAKTAMDGLVIGIYAEGTVEIDVVKINTDGASSIGVFGKDFSSVVTGDAYISLGDAIDDVGIVFSGNGKIKGNFVADCAASSLISYGPAIEEGNYNFIFESHMASNASFNTAVELNAIIKDGNLSATGGNVDIYEGNDLTNTDYIRINNKIEQAKQAFEIRYNNAAVNPDSGTGEAGGTGAGESGGTGAGATVYVEQFNSILNEFNTLIKDTSYQGVNLLKGADLTLTFNESRSNKFTVSGRDMSSENLGLITRDWTSKADVETSIKELTEAIDAIREFQTELGNNYSIIQTRQDFTEALVDVLETGADNLVLADMNEESANYLALQTRQQLATNSLSLAAQSAQSILSLF